MQVEEINRAKSTDVRNVLANKLVENPLSQGTSDFEFRTTEAAR